MQKPPHRATDLHPDLAARLEALLGAVVLRATPVAGGYTPTRGLLCTTSRGRFFVRVGATSWRRRCHQEALRLAGVAAR